jgi:hypothetical protein
VPQNELSDSEDDGEGRRNEHNYGRSNKRSRPKITARPTLGTGGTSRRTNRNLTTDLTHDFSPAAQATPPQQPADTATELTMVQDESGRAVIKQVTSMDVDPQ